MKKQNVFFSLLVSIIFIIALPLSASALHGDVNNDSCVGIEDAILALRFTTGIAELTEEQEKIGDLDYNGKITTEDVRLLMRGAAAMDYVPDHLFTKWEITTEPTCTEDGLASCYCIYCEKVVTKVIEKGHNVVPATCTKGSYCSVCQEVLSLPLGHKDENGYCSVCDTLHNAPFLVYKDFDIAFGSTPATVKAFLGEPQATYEDNTSAASFNIFVYYTDYKDLAVITFANDKLTQFYSNCPTAKVKQGNAHYGLYCKSAPSSIGEIYITAYEDTHSDGLIYSFCATVGEAYTLSKATDYTVCAKLNVHLTNGLRAINDVAPLQYCETVSAVATAHSTDMATRDYFEHTTPEGVTPGQRLTKGGITWYACAENIAAGIYDPYALANGWYNSEGHRKNILNARYKYLGVGFAYNESSSYKYYSTQNFYTDEY